MNRRQFLRSATLGSMAALCGISGDAKAAPTLTMLDTRVISRQPQVPITAGRRWRAAAAANCCWSIPADANSMSVPLAESN